MKMSLRPEQRIEFCFMFLETCETMRTYEDMFAILAGRLCLINSTYVSPFEQLFKYSYCTLHGKDMYKIRNISKFFAYLLSIDSISWSVLRCIRLTDDETTCSSRMFIKVLFLELSEHMGLTKLYERIKDAALQEGFDGLFPKDDQKKIEYVIDFFTSIGLIILVQRLEDCLFCLTD